MSKDKKIVTNEELIVSNMLQIEALIRILESEGLVTQEEVLEEIKLLKE